MQFNTAASILFATFTLAAAGPATPIQERQAGSVEASFFKGIGCNNPADIITPPSPLLLVEDTAPCHDITISQPVGCTELTNSTLTRTLRVYDQPGCREIGSDAHFWTFPPGSSNPNKFNQEVKSYRFF